MSTAETVERYRLTAELSWSHPPLNPMIYVPETHVMVSRFVKGREATKEERAEAFKILASYHLGLWDIPPHHTIVGPNGLVVIDWCVLGNNFRARRNVVVQPNRPKVPSD